MVDKTICCKQRLEDHGVGNQRGCARQEDHGAVDPFTLDSRTVEQLCQNQGQQQHDGNLNDKVKYRIEQTLLEGLIFQNACIVCDSDPVFCIAHARLERKNQRLNHWVKAKHKNQ